MSKKGIVLYTIGSEPGIEKTSEFYTALTHRTCGQYIPVRNANILPTIISSCCVEEISLERLMPETQQIINDQRENGIVDEATLIDNTVHKLELTSPLSRQCLMNNLNIDAPSQEAIGYSRLANMEEMRSCFKAKTYL